MGAKPAEVRRAAQYLRRRLANPLQAGLTGPVVEWQHQQDAAAGTTRSKANILKFLCMKTDRHGEDNRERQPRTDSKLPKPE